VNDLAKYLGVSLSTLARWRRENTGPSYAKVGKRVVYRKQAVEEFINNNTKGVSNE
jgi:excisionase family DNA binding protein